MWAECFSFLEQLRVSEDLYCAHLQECADRSFLKEKVGTLLTEYSKFNKGLAFTGQPISQHEIVRALKGRRTHLFEGLLSEVKLVLPITGGSSTFGRMIILPQRKSRRNVLCASSPDGDLDGCRDDYEGERGEPAFVRYARVYVA